MVVSSTAVNACSMQYSCEGRLAQYKIQDAAQSWKLQSDSGHKESVTQHSSMSAPDLPLCLAATAHDQQDWSQNQQAWSAAQIMQRFPKERDSLAPSGIWVD